MSVTINTNSAATIAKNNLNSSNSMLQKSLNRLSSGLKIVNPADDAGGLAVSMKMSAAIKRTDAVNTNIANAQSYLQTQDGALATAGKVLDRMSELKTMSTDVTKNATDIANYDTEFTALKAQLTSLSSEKFNGVSLFTSAGAATALIELYDSVSGDILVRAIDRRSARNFGAGFSANNVTNSAEARRIIRIWAVALREALDNARGEDVDVAGEDNE